ncbi:CHAT domain-containing protein [Lentinula boryana]|uniref:CHAT domain-containing protein n=1 Tax=Lentinula boryana TaxID=40481 RepID=A0ABQ8QDV7_9AGAR|nr:CHAT domain-containing protein [Lentinula boryana]
MAYLLEKLRKILNNILLIPLFYIQRPWLTHRGLRLLKRFDQTHEAEDLDSAISQIRRLVSLCPNGSTRATSLDLLSTAIRKRFDQGGKVEFIEEEISMHRETLKLRPIGNPDRLISLNNLSEAIRVRFEMLGQPGDLEESIDYGRQGLALEPSDPDQRAKSLSSLGIALCMHFEHNGEMDDLESGIKYFHQALDLRPVGHPKRRAVLSDLATSMRTRFRETSDMNDLMKAVAFGRDALDGCPVDDQQRPLIIGNLASALLTRFTQNGSLEDLEESIDLNRQALASQPLGHPDRPLTLGNLPIAILFRFGETGRTEDLEDCIQLFRESLLLFPEGHPDRAMALSNISSAILARFQQAGRIEDSDEGINILRETLHLLPNNHPYRAESLMNLAAAMLQRFELAPTVEALDEVVALDKEALEVLPPNHTYRATVLHSYAEALGRRFKLSKDIGDLARAVTLHEEALELWPPGHPEHCTSLKDLAMIIVQRFEQSGDEGDLKKALELITNAEEELPADHPKHTDIRVALATVLLRLHSIDTSDNHDSDYPSKAFNLFENAVNHSSASVKARFTAALEWISKAREYRHTSIIQAYTVSLTLLTRFLVATPSVELQHKFLRSTSTIPKTLASDAAAAAIDAEQLDVAIEFLEQGRSMLWSEMRNFRPPLEQLREVNTTFADELQKLTTQLEHQATSVEAPSMLNESPIPVEVRQKNHRILSERLDGLLGQIRKLEGFANFLSTVPFHTLRAAAAEGPIIVINVSQYRCDAIVVYYSCDPGLVHLPDIDISTLAESASHCSDPKSTKAGDFSKRLRQILQALWKTVVNPIVDFLAPTLPLKSRIWWCPTSYLCAVPLHAAGPYLPKQRNLPDLFVSSYTSTLSVLISARAQRAETVVKDLFVIADVGKPGSEIPSVQEELRRIQMHNQAAYLAFGENANKNNILTCLPQYRWVHFACHGHREQESFHSWFQLYGNDRLELIDLIHARLPNAELAFLSACHTAAVDVQGTPDEVIHLASALQFCGFGGVIGTLWAMADIDGPDVADDFYGSMFPENGSAANFRNSAVALNNVTKEMRKRKVPLDRWVNFVHIGA